MSVDQPDRIVASFPKPLFAAKANDSYTLLQQLRADASIESCYAFGEYMHLTLTSDEANEQTAKAVADKYLPQALELKKITPTIEDSFIRLMREQQMTDDTKESAHGK